ncbi:MAG: hypothetical protein M5U28_41730 [Sandaracinaceae bacterium]|nr:hypothetical protein [Sandaracinaceae bacterium]
MLGEMFGDLASVQLATIQETEGVPIAQLAAGRHHACLRSEEGGLRCWGRIGRFRTTPRDEYATRPTPMDGLAEVADVALGDGGGCVRRRDGQVVCWERAASSRQPYGATTTHAVPAARGAVGLAAHATRACAIRPDRGVICWTGDEEPVVVPGLADVRELAVGARHACALGADARVRCLGTTSAGEVGDDPVLVEPLEDVAQIVAGADHTCARMNDGRVWCWGGGRDDALGPTVRVSSDAPVEVPIGVDVAGIDAAGTRACARMSDGTVRCWGADVMSPAPVGELAGVAQIAVAPSHACAVLEDRTVRCWGGDSPTPVAVAGLAEVEQVVAADGYTAALANGRVFGWGALPDGGEASPTPRVIAALNGAAELSATDGMLCARLRGGTVSCLAGGPARPVRFVSGATGLQGRCATLRGERVRCWATRLVAGELTDRAALAGRRTRAGRCWITPEATVRCVSFGSGVVTGITGAREIVGGDDFHCVLADGGVRCFGTNLRGQLGDGRGGPGRADPVEISIAETEPLLWSSPRRPPLPLPTMERAGGDVCWLGEPRRVAGSDHVIGHVALAWHGDRIALLFTGGGSVDEVGALWMTAEGEALGEPFTIPLSMHGRVDAHLGEDALYLFTQGAMPEDPARLTVVPATRARPARASSSRTTTALGAR